MPEVTLPGTTLHYEDAGAGDPLLLLHGGLGTALLHYRREIPFFGEQYRVIAPDLRGYGRSSPPRDFPPDFYHRDAADMAALLDALGSSRPANALASDSALSTQHSALAPPVHVLGWSDGGIVALVLAATRPDLVRSLVVWGAEASLLEEERAGWAELADPSSWPGHAVERFKEAQGPRNWPGILERMLAGYNAVLDAGGEIISSRLGEIRCPTLIIHGEADPLVPVVHARALHAAIPHSELWIWPGVGHLPHREREAEFRALLLGFLARY